MDFNNAPYHDDFDENKNYYSVLFKAGYNVQPRELNVLQSMKQYQIGALGNHLFKNGAKISGCTSSFVQYDYIRLNDIDNKISSFDSTYKLIGATSKVEASFIKGYNKTSYEDALVLVIYTKSGINQEQTFLTDESIEIYNNKNELVHTLSILIKDVSDLIPVTGKSLVFVIDDGIFFYNSYFIKVHKQYLLVDRYLTKDTNGSIISNEAYRVGLDIVEDIITSDDDKSLLDPHFGAPNFGAPGADRYKINMYLSIRDYVEDGTNTNFITLAKVRQNHTVEYQKDDTEYAEIMKEFARRTYETYGNFTIIPWKAHFLNEKKTDINDKLGWSLNGDQNNYIAIVSPGEGYVNGYRASTNTETIVRGRKAIDIGTLSNQKVTVGNPTSIIVTSNTVADWGRINSDPSNITYKFNMYDSNNVLTGTFYAYDIYKIANNQYKIYLYNVARTGNIKIENTTSIKMINGNFIGNCATETFKDTFSYDSSQLIPTGLKNIVGISNVSLKIRTRLSMTLDATGIGVFNAPADSIFLTEEFIIAWVEQAGIATNVLEDKITITDNTISVDLGSQFANATFTMIATSICNNLIPRTKIKTQHTINLNGGADISKAGWKYTLKYDVSKLDSVTISFGDNTPEIDITNEYVLELGTNDNIYNNAILYRKVFRNINPDDVITIKYTYFEHSNDGSYFNINSYNINDIAEIPLYKGLSAADYFDFRSDTLDNSNSYFKAIPVPGAIIEFNAQYYMSRADLLAIDINSNIYIKEGIPGKVAKLPTPDDDSMPLYGIYLDALGTIEKAQTIYYDNQRRTAKDIRRLEKRISNVEDAITLTMLEQQTLNMSIKDQNGYDRFKNGFLVDNFKSFQASDLANIEYKASLDRAKGIVRPQFKQNNVKLKFNAAKSVNIKTIGNMVIKNYQDDLFIQNIYATQSVSINPYMIYCTRGSLALSPNIDTWSDDQYKPNIVADIDMGVDALREAAELGNITGTDYGAWINYNNSIISATTSVTESSTERSGNQNITTTTTTNTTNTTRVVDDYRNVTSTYIGSNMQSYSINDMVKDISIIPYIRQKTIQFYATNLKPNTRVYAFFDGVDVNLYCRMITQIDPNSGDVLVNRNASMFGTSTLISDANGNLIGEFRIPANTFFTGEKKFVLTNDPNNTGNPDIETTRCESVYFAGGVSQTKQNVTMNVITPTFGTVTTTENRQISSTSTSVSRDVSVSTVTIPEPVVVPAPQKEPERPPMPPRKPGYSNAWHWVWSGGQWVWDPVAQAFKVDQPCFISKVEVYFETVDDKADIIWFEIREMFNGYPTNSAIARKEIKGADLKKYESKDASIPFAVIWDVPVYVDASKSYAFVVGGFSPETRIFISKLGSKLLNSDNILEEPPLGYTMFRSLNGDTWNAEQYDTMKINIYRCVFDMTTSEINLYNENDNGFELNCMADPIEIQKGSNRVRIHVKDHNMRINDRIVVNFSNDIYYQITVTNNGIPQIGQPISTLSGSGYIKDVQVTAALNVYNISIDKMIGIFKVGEEFVCESRKYEYRDLFLASDYGAAGTPIIQNVVLGNVKSISESLPIELAGSGIELFAREHIVRDVDSLDSFIIEVESPFTDSGRFGGDNVNIYGHNIKYDVFNIAGQYLSYNCKEDWTLSAYSFNDTKMDLIQFLPLHDIELDNSGIIFSNRNESRIMGKDNSSFVVTAKFDSINPYISPVFNIDSFSVTTICNRIEMIDKVAYNNAPNGENRFKDETVSTEGIESFKHITTKVLLENAASDMKIMVDVHMPNQTDIDIYIKFSRPGSNDKDESLPWIKVDKYTKQNTTRNKDDFIAYNLLLSENCSVWSNTIEYISYRVKLVGRSPNSATPVIFKNLRAIAVT